MSIDRQNRTAWAVFFFTLYSAITCFTGYNRLAAAAQDESQSASPIREITYAGKTLAEWRSDIDSNQPVVRRRAALSMFPFVQNQDIGWKEALKHALQHPDPAVAFWACDAAAILQEPDADILNLLEVLAEDTRSPGLQLAANHACYCATGNPKHVEFLMKVIEARLTGDTFHDTKQMSHVMTATDYLVRIGAERLGEQRDSVVERLKARSREVVRRLDRGELHWQLYHPQKACDKAALLLSQPGFESTHAATSMEPDIQTRHATRNDLAGELQDERQSDAWSGARKPNILWISCEDISPNLGCYGDRYASTPNLDQLASQGVLFRNAFTHAGVCAVLRSGVITGRYPVSLGTQHMRSFRPTLEDSPCFPELLREAGYFCTNRSKTDYQFQHSPETWDREGNGHQDWRDRADGQPFFSVVNFTISHESQVRHGVKKHASILKGLSDSQHHQPAEAGPFLPPYFPNTPETRKDWAWYSDNISEMDRRVGELLKKLEDDGLQDSTIVVFWSDHGQGLPGGKRWLYDSGTHVPLLVRFPDRFAAGTERTDLVTLLDLAPTMLSLAGAPIPENMDGRVILGPQRQPEPEALFFHRDRMDETYDLIRSVRDHRFRYMRNYQPYRIYNQYLEYLELMPTMQVWRKLHHKGMLAPVSDRWFATKPAEELYDVQADPHQIRNLARDPEFQTILQTMRERLREWQLEQDDSGMTPEVIMLEEKWPD